MERAIYDAVSVIRADLPEAPLEVLPGKAVCEIQSLPDSTRRSGVIELMKLPPFRGRVPVFLGDDVTDETVFAIMPDLQGHAFSVGRLAKGVSGHFEDPKQCHARGLAQIARPRGLHRTLHGRRLGIAARHASQ